jgi:NTE family protein
VALQHGAAQHEMTKAVISRTRPGPLATQPRIALALGGGGARGLAHILIIEALEEMGVRPAVISGTSIGAIFGAALASGLPAAEIRAHTEEALSQRFDLIRQLVQARADPVQKLFNLLPLRSALLKPEALLDLVLPLRVAKSFEALQTPLRIVATDFYAQAPLVLSTGPLLPAVAASMALPAIFQPVAMGERMLVDGGLVNPLPFDVIAAEADITIAIDVSGGVSERAAQARPYPTAVESLFTAAQILQRSIVIEKLKSAQPDIYIDVDVERFHVLEFYRLNDILTAAAPAKDNLKRQLARVLGAERMVEVTAPVTLIDRQVAEPVSPPPTPKRKRSLGMKLPRPRKPRA